MAARSPVQVDQNEEEASQQSPREIPWGSEFNCDFSFSRPENRQILPKICKIL
jgi:hypothetical protein